MTPNRQQAIYDAFPDLFRMAIDKTGLMAYGLCVDDGWFKLIWELSEAIMAECHRLGLEPGKPGFPVAAQVKEKFGTLRFYLHPTTPPEPEYSESEVEDIRLGSGPGHDKMERFDQMKGDLPERLESIYDLVREAGEFSQTICERCGATGEMRQSGFWLRMRCEKCVEEEAKEQEEQSGR